MRRHRKRRSPPRKWHDGEASANGEASPNGEASANGRGGCGSGHRGRRAKARKQSVLEEIPGVGAKRRRELLRHFGSAKAIENAGIEELAKIKGISATIARTIYEHLHTVND